MTESFARGHRGPGRVDSCTSYQAPSQAYLGRFIVAVQLWSRCKALEGKAIVTRPAHPALGARRSSHVGSPVGEERYERRSALGGFRCCVRCCGAAVTADQGSGELPAHQQGYAGMLSLM